MAKSCGKVGFAVLAFPRCCACEVCGGLVASAYACRGCEAIVCSECVLVHGGADADVKGDGDVATNDGS
jgi:hypothetical protein